MGFANQQVKKGKLHTSPGLLKRIAQRARAAAGEARAAKKRAREKELEADRYYRDLRKRARGDVKPTGGRVGGKRKLNELFHELYGRNPKMAKKKTRKRKKRNGMPSGLKKYWAKMRAKRAARIPRKVRRKSYALLKRAVAKNKVRNYRKRRSNPKRRRTVTRISRVSRITLPAMSPAATKKTIALIRRLAGNRRVRVK